MLTLIFGVWVNLATVSNIVDVNNHVLTNSWGCSIMMTDGNYVFIPHKKCYDVGLEMKKKGL